MRKILYLVWAAIMSGCIASEDDFRIREAEALMAEHPDSALMLLEGMRKEESENEDLGYKVMTLTTQAKIKLNENVDNVDELKDAIAYFDRKGKKHWLLLAEYYTGIQLEGNDDLEAMNHLLNVEALAKETGDSFMLGMAYGHIADIYNSSSSTEIELEYAKKAYDCLDAAGYDRYANYMLTTIATAYINNKQYDKALDISRQLIRTGEEKCDSTLLAYGYGNLGFAYLGKKEYDRAVAHLRA